MSLADKRDLLARLLRDEAARDVDQLSVAQRRYWVLRQMERSVATHVVSTVGLDGTLDVAALEQAITATVRRRDDLTTGFVEVEGRPVRVTSTVDWVPLPVYDLAELSAVAQQPEIEAVVAAESSRPFDLQSPPLVRATLIRTGPQSQVLVLVAHQIVADTRSVQLLEQDVCAAYNTLTQGGQPIALSTPTPFAEFATFQRTWLESDEGQQQLEWWQSRLDELPALTLPTDHARPAVKVKGLHGGLVRATVPTATQQSMRAQQERLGADLDALVFAGWVALLARYSGQRDFAVGVVDGARDAEWDGVVGPCENTVPVRCVVHGDVTFGDLLAGTTSSWTEARAHRQVPFERLVEDVPQRQDVTHSPLFQVRFATAAASTARAAGGVSWHRLELPSGLAPFDLTLRVRVDPEADTVELLLDYATELYTAATARRILSHLVELLGTAAGNPAVRFSDLPLADADEHALIATFERLRRDPEPARGHGSLHELVEEQARRTPDAPALRGGGLRITFGELNRRANQLAHRLRSVGVGLEDRVAITADRRPEAVIAQLAVLKAGGAYVPLDPDYPAERVRFICDDAAVSAIIVTPNKAPGLVPEGPWKIVLAQAESCADESPENPEPLADHLGSTLAYAIYTSGTSGRPKGVLVPHAAIRNATQNRTGVFPGPVDAYLMLAPLSFDASGAGVYWTLATGGQLVVPSEDEVRDPRRLAALMRESGVSHFDGVPSQYGVLLESQPEAVAGLRCVILAGERLSSPIVARHVELAPGTPLFNEYGPTEGTVWSTVHECSAEDAHGEVPIGRPVRGVRVSVVDENLRRTPIGIGGELCLGGAQIARGYLGQPELTAERFVPDPTHPGERMYRTGDLGRWRADGELEFLGRVDSQVKVRGYRVELAEIETVLLDAQAVASAAVVVRAEGESAHLIAYVAPSPGVQLVREELERFVRDRLPAYMLPQQYVVLETMPLTDRGKVDRAALPDPSPDLDRGIADYEAPRTKIEREVAAAFAESLGQERIGRHQDFFELGGNSLLIARVGSRLSKAYGVDLPLHSLFTTPTVVGVATTIEVYRKEGYQGLLAKRDPQLLVAEAQLPAEITPEGLPLADAENPQGVLLTGGTGYLGIFLAERLLDRTDADLYCLVRAEDEAEALARLKSTAEKFKLRWTDEWQRRVHAVVGDLAQPRFGMTEEAFDQLSADVDVIYHNGALVNFVYPYTVLKAPNVGGTVEVLRLACRTKAKVVHHVSTIDVLVGAYIPRPFIEKDLPPLPPRVPFSYPQSKWIAEKMVVTARERGLRTTIFRPSIMMGHQDTGACHETDYILTALRGFLDLGILPVYEEILNSVTVDYASAVLVEASLRPTSIGGIFHIWNTDALPTMDTYEWIRSFGYEFDLVPFAEATARAMKVDPSHPIYPLLPVLFLYTGGDAGLPMEFEAHKALDPASECARLFEATSGTGITCAPIDEKLIHNCLEFLLAKGFLPEPKRRGRR